jgi:hypothetical protein
MILTRRHFEGEKKKGKVSQNVFEIHKTSQPRQRIENHKTMHSSPSATGLLLFIFDI